MNILVYISCHTFNKYVCRNFGIIQRDMCILAFKEISQSPSKKVASSNNYECLLPCAVTPGAKLCFSNLISKRIDISAFEFWMRQNKFSCFLLIIVFLWISYLCLMYIFCRILYLFLVYFFFVNYVTYSFVFILNVFCHFFSFYNVYGIMLMDILKILKV